MASAPTRIEAGAAKVGDTVDGGHYGADGRSAWLDVDWREHQRWVSVDDRPVNVIDLGDGPPVVFVHGLSGNWTNWLENLPHFAARHRVVAMDLPGFGHSPMPAEPISIAGYAACVDRLLEALGIDSAAIVGNSMGGFIGAELAIRVPDRVQRLVLVSAAGISVQDLRDGRLLPLARRGQTVLAAYSGWLASRSEAVTRRPRLRRVALNVVAAHPDRLPAPLAAEMLRGSGKPGFMDALEALADYAIRDRLGEIACPTLIVWGDRDQLVPVADAEVFERLIPDSRKVIYRDTGHCAMFERPAAFNAELDAFLPG